MASFNTEGSGHVFVEVGPDIHICGFCKQQYNNFEVFLAHKQNGCSLPSSEVSAPNTASTLTDSSAEFVFEETYQTCFVRGVKNILTKAQKTPSKKLKPALTSKRRSCCFSGCAFKTQYGQKDMERHLKTHTGEKPFECELCHKRFSRRDKLNMHSRSHTGEKPHKCSYCQYAAADSSSLKKHLRIHYDQRPFKCQICPYASRNSSQLTVHLRSHTGDAPFQCQQCDAKFKINSDLKRHVRIHSGEKPYKCEFCDYRCAMKGNLKSHIQIKHSANVFHCLDCDFQCQNKTALRQHARQHQPTQPIACSKCSYSCSSKGALKVHERIHSEERPFRCDFCTFATKQRSNLVIHKKKCHSDKKPEKGSCGGGVGKGAGGCSAAACDDDLLPKPASSRYRAKLDATRAFRCDRCDASFVREDSLRSHSKQHRDSQTPTLPLSALSPAVAPCRQTSPLLLPSLDPSTAAYSSAQLRIMVSHPLGPEGSFLQTPADGPGPKAGALLLSPENQELVVNSMMQQVGLLMPLHQLGSQAVEEEGTLEGQTVLLTQLSSSDTNPLHQALLQTAMDNGNHATQTFITTQDPGNATPTFITSQDNGNHATQTFITTQDSGNATHTFITPQDNGNHATRTFITTQDPGNATQTFITTCSDLEGLSALIQEGGTEVTVVTEGNAPMVATVTPPEEVCDVGEAEELSGRTATMVPIGTVVHTDSGLLGPGISMGGGVVIHGLPLILSSTVSQQPGLGQLASDMTPLEKALPH